MASAVVLRLASGGRGRVLAPGLHALHDHFVDRMEVAIAQLFLYKPHGFGFEVDRYGGNLARLVGAVNLMLAQVRARRESPQFLSAVLSARGSV
jgi:hypothetical protein